MRWPWQRRPRAPSIDEDLRRQNLRAQQQRQRLTRAEAISERVSAHIETAGDRLAELVKRGLTH